MKSFDTSSKLLKLFEEFLRNTRYLVIVPLLFLIISLVYVVILMGGRIWAATAELFTYENPFSVLVYLIDIVDFTVICIIILLIIRAVYGMFIRPLKFDEQDKAKADKVLINDIDELKHKLGKVVIVSLVIHMFKQLLIFNIQTSTDMILMGVLVLVLAGALYLSEKAGSILSSTDASKKTT